MNKQHKGFTLIETVIVIFMSAVLLTALSLFIANSMGTYENVMNQSSALNKLRYVVERISKEVRQVNHTGAAYQINTFTSTQFDYFNSSGVQIVFDYDAATDLLTVSYSSPAVSSTMSDNVSALSFNYYESDGTTVALAAANIAFVELSLSINEGGVTYASQTRVALRDGQ